jgi:two-component system, sensor histidine kinase PdtaS
MTIANVANESEFQRSTRRAVSRETRAWKKYLATKAALTAALVREKKSLREKGELLRRQDILTQEFEHRLANSLQLIVGLLSLQSSAATTVEAAEQLTIAAKRVTALGRVHQRLHLLDRRRNVQFKQYLQDLCDDLSDLLLQEKAGRAVVVSGTNVKLPTVLGIPLGFIVSELITNSAKYAKGNITVRMEKSATGHLLSVSDDGPGLPAAYDPARSKGLGMEIVQTLVKQIGGALQFAPGDGGHGTRVTVAFRPQL